jgi:abortive infection bacteriophage resistance protein
MNKSLSDQLQSIKDQNNNYKKAHKTFEEQLELLKSRGLSVSNDNYALLKLRHINYYRLSAYFLPLQYPKAAEMKDHFLPGTAFEVVLEHYYFDTQLRKIIFEAIERIEIYFRTQIAYHHSKKYGPFGYLSHENLKCDADFFTKLQTAIREEKDRSSETFIAHFKAKYDTTDLPIWAMVEVVSMSTLSRLYAALHTKEQQAVIQPLKGITKDVFHSWFHALTVIRNICAHHARLWNKTLGVKFEVPKKVLLFRQILATDDKGNTRFLNDKVFFALSVIVYILDAIGEELDFRNNILELVVAHPTIDLKAMGFPEEWQNFGLWQNEE